MVREDTQFPRKRTKTGGRARGTPNRATAEGREFARQLVMDRVYREELRERLIAGRVPPGIEVMLWYYAYGKPKEQLELSGSISHDRDLNEMSTDDLLAEIEKHNRETAAFLAVHHRSRTPRSQGD